MHGRVPTLFAVTLVCVVAACTANKNAGGDVPASRAGASSGNGGASAGGATGSAGSAGRASASGAGNFGAAGVAGAPAAGAGGSSANGGASSSGGNTGVNGGASSSAGTAGAGAGGTTATTPCSSRPGMLFCDDFESAAVGAVPAAPWSTTFVGGSSSVTIDSSVPAHSGTKSVLVHPTKDGYQTLLIYHDAAVLPQANGRFFFRAFVRPDQPMSAGHNTLVIGDTFASPGTGNTTRLGEDNNMLIMTVGGDAHGYNSNPNYYTDHLPGVEFPAQAYTCLEMLFDAPNSEIDVWVNGTEVPALHVTGLAHENYDTVRFGLEKYAGNDTAGDVSDFWYDDIAIGTQQLGCN
jgi:hypothetical protein